MKRLIIAILVVAAAGMFFPTLTILARPGQTPHENPATAEKAPGAAALLLSYSQVFDTATTGEYQNARSMLKDMESSDIFAEMTYIIRRYNTLAQELLGTLDDLQLLIDEATASLSHDLLGEAQQKLEDAAETAQLARSRLDDIVTATQSLRDSLGVSTAPAASPLRKAYSNLQDSLRRLTELTAELDRLRESLTIKREAQARSLIPTEVSLSATPAEVFIGDRISVSGRLSTGSSPMPDRPLAILSDNETLLVTTTNQAGAYEADLALPYKYKQDPAMPFQHTFLQNIEYMLTGLNAVYVPPANDAGTYQGSKSQPVPVSFYSTLLEAAAPATAYPGTPFTISGYARSTGVDTNRKIIIYLDDNRLVEETAPAMFNLAVTLPGATPAGEHRLTLVAAPDGRYSGAASSLTINVSKPLLQATIESPQLIIVPRPLQVSGRVYHQLGPVQDALISLKFRNSTSMASTTADGSFGASLNAGLDLSLAGPQQLTITIEQLEPWYGLVEVERQIFVLNPANMGLLLVAFLSLGLLVYKKGRTRPREEKAVLQPHPGEMTATAPMPEARYDMTSVKGRILSAYAAGLEVVAKRTGTTVAPHITLRELMESAACLSPTIVGPFAELTAIAELALYSARELDEGTAGKAGELAATIKEVLNSET